MLWRNVHLCKSSELDSLLRDARVLSWVVFKMVHGPELYPRVSADNSYRVSHHYRDPVVTPTKRGERTSPPRVKDKVLVIDDGEELFGHIVGFSDDDVRIYMYRAREVETFQRDCLQTIRTRASWRIG